MDGGRPPDSALRAIVEYGRSVRRWLGSQAPELIALTAAFALSVAWPLSRGVVALEGGRPAAARVDLVVASLPQGWATLVALLWAPLVTFRKRRRAPAQADSTGAGTGRPGPRIVAGTIGLTASLAGGVFVGTALAMVTGSDVVLGNAAAVAALLATMLILYLVASALIVGFGRFWTSAAVFALAMASVRWLAVSTGWSVAQAVQDWITVGRLGLGTMMEAPALAAGLVPEAAWEGVSPWPAILVWLGVAVATVTVAARKGGANA